MVGEHLNVRLALRLTESNSHRQPSAQGRRLPAKALLLLLFCSLPLRLRLLWQQAILGQPRLCVAVPGGRVARGNGAIWKAFQSPHLKQWNCLFFDKVIRNRLTRSDSACAPDSGASGKLRLGPGLGGSRPDSHRLSAEPQAQAPHRGAPC